MSKKQPQISQKSILSAQDSKDSNLTCNQNNFVSNQESLKYECTYSFFQSIREVGRISTLAVSPLQNFIALGDLKKKIHIWERIKGLGSTFYYKQLYHWIKLPNSCDSINHISFSTGQDYIMVVDKSYQLFIYNFRKFEFIASFRDTFLQTREAVFIPDTSKLLYYGKNFLIKVWDLDTRKHFANLRGHSQNVTCFTNAKSGILGASGCEEGNIIFWDLERLQKIQKMKAHASSIISIDFSQDSNKLLSITQNEIRIWDTRTYHPLFSKEVQQSFLKRAFFSNNNNYFLTICENSLQVWDSKGNNPIKTLKLDPFQCVDIIQDQNLIVTGSWEKSVKFYSLKLCKFIGQYLQSFKENGLIISNSFYLDRFAILDDENQLSVYRRSTGLCYLNESFKGFPTIKTICAKDRFCLMYQEASNIEKFSSLFYLFDLQRKKLIAKKGFLDKSYKYVDFCNNDKNILFAWDKNRIMITDLQFKVLVKRNIASFYKIVGCQISNRIGILLFGSSPSQLIIFKAQSTKLYKQVNFTCDFLQFKIYGDTIEMLQLPGSEIEKYSI